MKNNYNFKERFEKAKAELNQLYLISNAVQTTLRLDEILFIILTGVTAKEGLGFNRAMLFLVNEENETLEGKMGIGPQSSEEAAIIWHHIETEKVSFEDLISAYKNFNKEGMGSFNTIVKTIKIPLHENQDVITMTALEGMPFEITNAEAKNKVNPQIKELLKLDEFVAVPLIAKEKVVGIILADNKFSSRAITKEDVKILSMFAYQAGLAIENSRLYEEKEKMSQIDSLTGLYNHGHFQYLLNEEIKRSRRFNHPTSIILLDIDHFKIYNDTLGHPAGDDLLRVLSKLLGQDLRETDTATRYGGEEFVITLPQTSKEEAFNLAQRLRKKVESFAFKNEEVLPEKKMTISLGIATFPDDAQNKDGLIDIADKALYRAKQTGRNKVLKWGNTL